MKKSECFFRQSGRWGLLLIVALLTVSAAPDVVAQEPSTTVFAALQVNMAETPFEAPAFSLPATDGSMHSLEDYRGKLVFLNFWTTW